MKRMIKISGGCQAEAEAISTDSGGWVVTRTGRNAYTLTHVASGLKLSNYHPKQELPGLLAIRDWLDDVLPNLVTDGSAKLAALPKWKREIIQTVAYLVGYGLPKEAKRRPARR